MGKKQTIEEKAALALKKDHLQEHPEVPKDSKLAKGSISEAFDDGMRRLANTLSMDLTPKGLAKVYTDMKSWEDNLADLIKNARDRILALVQRDGEKVTDAGTMKLIVDDVELSIQPRKTGYDDKKVEAMVRNKGLDPSKCMTPVLIFKADAKLLESLKGEGKVAQAELDACKHDLAYNVMTPKAVVRE